VEESGPRESKFEAKSLYSNYKPSEEKYELRLEQRFIKARNREVQ
jgi:hypothetical protein